MGGNLFNLPRLPRADYLERENELRVYLEQKLGAGFRIPRFYASKPDFGDMDVLVAARDDWKSLRFDIAKELGITQHKIVGHVFSTVYKNLQVDFFSVEAQHLEPMYNYMSFNDLGNIIGKIFRRFNLKYGEFGLSYVYRRESNEHYKQDLPITTKMQPMLEFLGLDPAPWIQGFETLDQMFSWVIGSKYFSVAPYLDESISKLEKRLETRPTMQRFHDFLLRHNIQKRVEFLERHEYIELIAGAFPESNLLEQILEQQVLEQQAIHFAEKFSGQLVMRLRPELEGKALGAFITRFKAQFIDFETWVLEADTKEIEQRIHKS